MAKKKNIKPIVSYDSEALSEIANNLLNWLREKEENFHTDEFLYVLNPYFKNDIEYYRKTDNNFNLLMDQAETIELTKLKKFASADRLNASIVKQILINKHGWI